MYNNMYNNTAKPSDFFNQAPYPQVAPYNMGNYPPVTRSVVPGRMVDSLEEIMVGEVPQDGSLGLFPQKDGSKIYAKMWTSDGKIRTMTFVPSEQDDSVPSKESVQQDSANNDSMEKFMAKVDQRFDDLMDLLTSPDSKKHQNGSDSGKE